MFRAVEVKAYLIGQSTAETSVNIVACVGENETVLYSSDMRPLRDKWESTSFALDKLQANPECVIEEEHGLHVRSFPPFKTTYQSMKTLKAVNENRSKYRVAIIRDEGSNGDREMTSAFYSAVSSLGIFI